MDVLLLNTMFTASSYYRVIEPARVIQEAGSGVRVTVSRGLATTMSRGAGGVVTDVDSQGADVVVMQLPKTVEMLQCLRLLQQQGVAVVMESDDLLSAVAYGTPGHDALVRKGLATRAAECAREADWVTATSPALVAEYARHGRGSVVPNAVPRRIAELPPAYERAPSPVTVGWSGSVYGHPYDLQQMGSGLQQALHATVGQSRFLVLGQKGDMRARLGLSEEPLEVTWLPDVDSYLTAVGELFDVGIAPLRIDRFNTAKSWLKVLEYSARGVCSVRSPSAEYERLGLGWRAKAGKDWAKGITKAVQDPEWRREQARAAREVVLERHLTEHTVPLWVAAWERAAEHRAAARRRAFPVAAG